MDITEYLERFASEGAFSVDVKFRTGNSKVSDRRVCKRYVSPEDLATFVQQIASIDKPRMSFDEHICEINEIQIDLAHKQVHLGVS